MKIMNYFKGNGIILLVLLLCSCASVKPYYTYKDKKLPDDQVAIIKPSSDGNIHVFVGMNKRTIITKIDNKDTYGFWYYFGGGHNLPIRDIYVEPGKHIISLEYQYGNLYSQGDLWMVAEPGETYYASAAVCGYNVSFMIKDSEGNPTGGILGSIDEPNGE